MSKLTLEMLCGPLDGAVVSLEDATEWTKVGAGPLAFPWDEELGAPQACFRPSATGWQVECFPARHGTYRANLSQKITAPAPVQAGDVLKASATWLLVHEAE